MPTGTENMPILKNPKHEIFCEGIVRGLSAGKAYSNAGYSSVGADQNAARLIRKDNIQARIDEMRANIEKKVEIKVGVSKAYVIDKLRMIVERSTQGEQILDREGNPTGEWKYDSSGANKALELIGKELGMFQGRDVDGNPGQVSAIQVIYLTNGIKNEPVEETSESI